MAPAAPAASPEAPARTLDELFRKTKATPPLYWLPLSDEAAAVAKTRARAAQQAASSGGYGGGGYGGRR